MAIHFNHTILSTHDSKASSTSWPRCSVSGPTAVGTVFMVTTEYGANCD